MRFHRSISLFPALRLLLRPFALALLLILSVQPATAAPRYGNNDVCELQALLVIERFDNYHPRRGAGFNEFYRGAMNELVNSDLLDGQPNQRKIFLLNSLHYSANAVYRQRPSNRQSKVRLQKKLAATCSRQLNNH